MELFHLVFDQLRQQDLFTQVEVNHSFGVYRTVIAISDANYLVDGCLPGCHRNHHQSSSSTAATAAAAAALDVFLL